MLTTFFKILSVKNIFLLLPYVLLMRIVAIGRDLIMLNFTDSLARMHAILWVIFNFKLIAKKRKKIQKMRKADDRLLFRIFSERYLFR